MIQIFLLSENSQSAHKNLYSIQLLQYKNSQAGQMTEEKTLKSYFQNYVLHRVQIDASAKAISQLAWGNDVETFLRRAFAKKNYDCMEEFSAENSDKNMCMLST